MAPELILFLLVVAGVRERLWRSRDSDIILAFDSYGFLSLESLLLVEAFAT